MRRAPLASIRAAAASVAIVSPVLLATAAALPAPAPAPAHAPSEDTQPRWVVVTQKDTPARCDDFERFYKVATFQPGQVLRLDAESEEWARVVYPAALHALVPAGDARGAGQGMVQLAIDSRLRAPSAVLGIAGSWHSLYAQPLPAGTRLEVVGEELGTNGEVIAYRVKPPMPPVASEAPYAFVKLAALRDATQAEIDAHTSKARPIASEADVTPVDTTPAAQHVQREEAPGYSTELLEPMVRPGQEQAQKPAQQPAQQPTQNPASDPSQPKTTPSAPSRDNPETAMPWTPEQDASSTNQDAGDQIDLLSRVENEPAQRGGGSDGAPENPQGVRPEQTSPAPAQPADQAPAKPRLAPKPASVEDLESSLTAARGLDTESLDIALDELVAEFRRTLAAEETKRDADDRILEGLRRRVAWLELRIDTRDQRRAIDDALRVASDRDREVAEGVRRWQSARSYVVVGRLAPSSVYDGKRLPLMYRVQSVDPVLGSRTIAYVRPSPDQDMAGRLGQIVGIVGQSADDDALRLRIIRPERVDQLNSAFAQEPVSTE